MTIEIETRLYKNIAQWCDANNIDVEQYISKVLTERITIDKYGDLNDRITQYKKTDYESDEEPVIVSDKKEESKQKPKKIGQITDKTVTNEIPEEPLVEETIEEEIKETKPKKRKLNSK